MPTATNAKAFQFFAAASKGTDCIIGAVVMARGKRAPRLLDLASRRAESPRRELAPPIPLERRPAFRAADIPVPRASRNHAYPRGLLRLARDLRRRYTQRG